VPEGRFLFWHTVSAILRARAQQARRDRMAEHYKEFPMLILQQFLWGFLGSLAVEIVHIHVLLGTSRKLPLRYSKPIYWIARLLLALTAGSLAVAYDIKTPVLALHVGAATPLIVQALAQHLGNFLVAQSEDLIEKVELQKGKLPGRRNPRVRENPR
jgi:hypothetical protein